MEADKDLFAITKEDRSSFVKDIKARMRENRATIYKDLNDKNLLLDELHYATVLGMGGLFPTPEVVHAIMSPSNGAGRRTVLDLGCRTGIWAIEMGRAFPLAEIIGIDKAPITIPDQYVPKNCRFEVGDLDQDMPRFHDYFDVVFVRSVTRSTTNYGQMMQIAEGYLKPGGIVIFIESDAVIYQKDSHVPLPPGLNADEGGSPEKGCWMHRIAREFNHSTAPEAGTVIEMMACMDKGIWHHPEIDPDTAKGASMYTPVGPWLKSSDREQYERLNFSGSVMRLNVQKISSLWQTSLVKVGIPEVKAHDWFKRLDQELESMSFPMSVRWRCAWGRRRAGKNLPAPPLPNIPISAAPASTTTVSADPYALGSGADSTATIKSEYKSHQVYLSKEDAEKASDQRKEAEKMLPIPLVVKILEEKRKLKV